MALSPASPSRISLVLAGLGLVPLLGCPAGDDTQVGSTADGSSTEAPESTTSTSGAPADSSSSADVTESTGAPPEELVPASGVRIDWVEANQGVGVPIGLDGAWVGPSQRLARLLQNRITLVRAFWTIEPDFVPREIEAHLLLEWEDGTTDRLVQTRMIDGDSFIGDLDRVFFWGIEAERTIPGLTYAIELYEHDPSAAVDPPAEPPYFPEVEGEPVLIGIEGSYQHIKVTVVPFNYDSGDSCVTEPDISEETMQEFRDQLYMMNPVDEVQFTLHESIDWNTPLENFGQLNSFMSDLRFEENAPPEMYYYGLVDVCSGGLGEAGGQAFGIPEEPSMELAYQRVSSGLSLDVDWSSETFVHEVGHSQGRRHVACEGEGGPDPSYPHIGGDVGEWGFGVIDFGLRHPTFNKDYMTYCHPVWVGTWGWNKVQPFVETLSMWDPEFPDGAPAPDDPYGGFLLVGALGGTGTEDWIIVPGRLPKVPSSDTTIDLAYGDGRVGRLPAFVEPLADTQDIKVVAQLPGDLDGVLDMRRTTPAGSFAIDASRMRGRHRVSRSAPK